MLGDSMLPVALSAGLLQHGYGAGDIGYAMASFTACFAGLVVFGGVFADRFSARGLMIGADLVRVGTQSLAAWLFFSGHVVLWQICLIGAVNGVAGAMFQPGVASTVPQVARDVQEANGVVRVAESLMALAGPALAGVLVALHLLGRGVRRRCRHVRGQRRLPAAAPAARARCAEPGGAAERSSFRADLVEGWREFRARTWMWSVIVVWMGFVILVMGR